ncbi:MAG: hypothetical protein J6X18_00170 [Bacteroidales bacterium]|nr:hypothetical protein [Bacteroidales bacterium]
MKIIFYHEGAIACWDNPQCVPNVNDEVVLDNIKTNTKEVWFVREKLVFPDKVRCYCYKSADYYTSHTDAEDYKFEN